MRAYTGLTGRTGHGYWEVMDVVGFLPAAGAAGVLDRSRAAGPARAHLLTALAAVS